jgi:HAD superfamily hydrolase (TIGR01662 family)
MVYKINYFHKMRYLVTPLKGYDAEPMKLIILDRDGVINYDYDHYIKSPEEWIPIPGSLEAIARLTHAGYHIGVATNQSGVGHGLFNIETLHCIHQKMHHLTFEAGGLIEVIYRGGELSEQTKARENFIWRLEVRLANEQGKGDGELQSRICLPSDRQRGSQNAERLGDVARRK